MRVEQTGPTVSYRNFALRHSIVLVVRDRSGEEVKLDFICAVVERKGVYKIYSVKD
jgi:hypothetical protein